MKQLYAVAILLLLSFGGISLQPQTYVAHYSAAFPGPQAYKDPISGTLLYVETDGRHVAAISSTGKLLWNRDPFSDAHLEFYRTHKPQIVFIGSHQSSSRSPQDAGKYVAITFNSSQFGLLKISNGDFELLGRD